MTAPKTEFEISGGWTSLAQESAFLTTVADETPATVTVAGQSVRGRNIYRFDLGTGTARTMLIASLIHANEPATREALLAFLRDLAYSTDPAIASYLAAHRIVALVPCNPDSFPTLRNNSNNVNMNRDFYKISQPETRVILNTVRAVRPDVILDMHEYHGTASQPDWMGFAGGNPLTHPAIREMEAACYAAGHAALVGRGYTSNPYYWGGIPRAGLSTIAGPLNAIGILSETNTAHSVPDRILIQRHILDTFLEWHGQNSAACRRAVTSARRDATITRATVPLLTEEYLANDTDPTQLIGLAGYQLDGPLPEHVAAFGIVATPGGFVSLQQESRLVIPSVLDPASPDRADIGAFPVPLPVTGPARGFRVFAQGKTRRVLEAKVRLDGRTYRVRL